MTSLEKSCSLGLIATTAALVGNLMFSAAVAQEAQPDNVMRIKLEIDGPDNEWIRIEERGNLLRLIHTVRFRSRSGAGGVANFLIDSIGPSDVEFSSWRDHQTTRILFVPDRCPASSATPERYQMNVSAASPAAAFAADPRMPPGAANCAIAGTDTLLIPEDVDIRQGQFTLEYLERDLVRSVTFRLPAEER